MFRSTNSVTLCQNSVFSTFWGCQKRGFRKENCIFVFSFLCWWTRNRKMKKWKWKRQKKPIKIGFLKVVIQNREKIKKWILSKNCLTFVSGREKNAHFRAHYLFWPIFFGPKQCKAGNTIKIGVSAEIAKKQKWHLFLEKGVFWHGWKTFTNCVFEKLCFIVFSAKHSFSKCKTVCWKTRKFMKNSGLWNMAKWCFWVCFLSFSIIVVCFWCVWHSFKSVKNAFFPICWAFPGWLVVVHLGLEGLCVFVFLVFVFVFCVAFVSVLFALLLVLWLDVVVLFFFCF